MPPMAWGALSLAIVSFVFIGLGVLFTPIPGVGAFFSFAAPLLALAGIILGGRAVTKSKAAVSVGPGGGAMAVPAGGEAGSGLALAAVIASALAFVPAVITALTCGACNALCATGSFQTHQNFGTGTGTGTGTIDPFDLLRGRKGSMFDQDAGLLVPNGPAPDAGAAEPPAPTAPGALPPPPLAPGPAP
jgi:hypothetical protein